MIQKISSLEEGKTWVHANRSLWSVPGLVLLSGPMGAGKTQLTTWILNELGSKEGSSPTFAIHQHYPTSVVPIDHFDLYRLESASELEGTGFWDLVQESGNLVIVEWADRLPASAYPKNRRRVSLEIQLDESGVRTFEWSLAK